MSGDREARDREALGGGFRPMSAGRPLGPPPGSEVGKEWAREAQARNEPVMVQCSACEHSWPCAYLPMPLEMAAKLMQQARCPKGCMRPIHLANMPVQQARCPKGCMRPIHLANMPGA